MNKQDVFSIVSQMTLDDLEAIDQKIRISMLTSASLLILCGFFIQLNS